MNRHLLGLKVRRRPANRGVRLVDVHLDDEFELVVGGHGIGRKMELWRNRR